MRADVKAGDAAAARPPRSRSGVPAPEFAAAIEALTRDVHDPVAKLRVLRRSLERYDVVNEEVAHLPSPVARRWAFRLLRLEGLRALALRRRAARASGRGRSVALTAAAAVAVLAAAALALALRGSPTAPGEATAAASLPTPATPAPAAVEPSAQPAAESSPASAAPPATTEVWLVETGRDHELYSNGLRIETGYAIDGPLRRFRPFDLDGRLQEPIEGRPVGVLFHTSESDVWPMQSSFNENLRDSSQRLLRYLQREHVYNYLIDRFGRVYRVVRDEARANHAGHSIWAAGGRVYLNLNNAFLGVSFESQWGGGRVLPITEPQFQAGRLLTAWLRQHWQIGADMCVTHGLTSVNPRKHLIGHHVDWARGFPFAAFGLPDHSTQPAPSVALFGFGYDDELLRKMGEPWDGVRAAERLLEDEARRRGLDLEALRRERRALYDRWIGEQARGDGGRGGARRVAGGDPARPERAWRPAPAAIDFGASGG